METLHLTIFLIGNLIMSIFFLNNSALEKFRNSLEYPEIVKSISIDNKIVSLDWVDALKKIQASDTLSLEFESQSISFMHPHHVEINAVYEVSDDEIEIDAHVFTGLKNTDIFDEMLSILSRTSMPEININYDNNGPCDIYLYRDNYAICIYNNIIIELNATNKNTDIKYIANYLFNIMSTSVIEARELNKINAIIKKPEHNIKLNHQFTVFTKIIDAEKHDIQLLNLKNEEFEFISQVNNEFNIKAIKTGKFILNFGIMNKRTLISQELQAEVNIVY
ncbi:MAG: hypothetical protein QM500_15300 [Methylococcales bacterium]